MFLALLTAPSANRGYVFYWRETHLLMENLVWRNDRLGSDQLLTASRQ
jgi:hypothetical protein